jgi:GNAT superfamily N-acetyltransferase
MNVAPLGPDDVDAVTAVWRAAQEHDDGDAEVTRADVVGCLGRPSLVLERDTVGVRDGGALVGFAMQVGRLTFAQVAPSFRGRGIGTWLLEWTQQAARATGAAATAQAVSAQAHDAIALLESHGYTRRWDDWMFEIALDAEPPAPVLPPGYAIRTFEPGRDERTVHALIERAFSEWPDYHALSFEDWRAMALERPGFTPALLSVLVQDAVVGAVLMVDDEGEGWIEQLAVAREHRGRGLGGALLQHAFRSAWDRGSRRCGLATDERTGARALYEHVGMEVRRTFHEYVKPL